MRDNKSEPTKDVVIDGTRSMLQYIIIRINSQI